MCMSVLFLFIYFCMHFRAPHVLEEAERGCSISHNRSYGWCIMWVLPLQEQSVLQPFLVIEILVV